MTSRAHISRKVELAAALLQIPGADGSPPIPYEHAKLMTPDQVISLFHRDHYPIRKEDGGPDAHWNLTWRFIGEHRKKTATIDKPQSDKGKRLRDAQAAHRSRMEIDRPIERARPKGRIRSRGFDKRFTKKMRTGEVVPRRRATANNKIPTAGE